MAISSTLRLATLKFLLRQKKGKEEVSNTLPIDSEGEKSRVVSEAARLRACSRLFNQLLESLK